MSELKICGACYVIPKGETTIFYEEKKCNRTEGKIITFKGKLEKTTYFEVLNRLKQEIAKTESEK